MGSVPGRADCPDESCPGYRPDQPALAETKVPLRVSEVLSQADAVVAINKSMHQRCHVLGADRARITRIPSGVDFPRYATVVPRPEWLNGIIKPGRYFLFLGPLVLTGCRSVDRSVSFPGGTLWCAPGDCGEREGTKVLAADVVRQQLGRRVHFVGAVEGDDKTYLLQNALCTVVPSRATDDVVAGDSRELCGRRARDCRASARTRGVDPAARHGPACAHRIVLRADWTHWRMWLPTALARMRGVWPHRNSRGNSTGDGSPQQHLELYASLSCSSTRRRAAA